MGLGETMEELGASKDLEAFGLGRGRASGGRTVHLYTLNSKTINPKPKV